MGSGPPLGGKRLAKARQPRAFQKRAQRLRFSGQPFGGLPHRLDGSRHRLWLERLHVKEELVGIDTLQPLLRQRRARKVLGVERDDDFGPARDRRRKHMYVVRIRKPEPRLKPRAICSPAAIG